MLNDKLKDLLSISEIKNGVIEIPTATKEDMMQIYSELSSSLMNCKIPHYKVIGVYIPSNAYGVENFISKQVGVNKSYTELYKSLNNLIFVINKKEDIEFAHTIGKIKIGGIEFLQAEGNITSSNNSIYFAGGKIAEALVQDINIISLERGLVLRFMIAESTSIIDFAESEFIIKNYFKSNPSSRIYQYREKFVPIRAVYDLNGLFLLKPYTEDDENRLHLIYKKKIKNKVLTKIIQKFVMA